MEFSDKIDLHIHTTASDGTDSPEEIVSRVREAGLELFAVTDHDAVKSSVRVMELLAPGDPAFLAGIEFSCRDEEGKYHILGYGFDPASPPVEKLIGTGHALRMEKVNGRLAYLRSEFGFEFPEEELSALLALDNPGKPHIGNLMVKYGYAETKEQAIRDFIDLAPVEDRYLSPEEAVRGILEGGGIPVLAHPSLGSGDQYIVGEAMDRRLRRLRDFGLRGVEAFYSGFTDAMQAEMLAFAEKYGLYVTAGSDFHGRNKPVRLGDNRLDTVREYPKPLFRFLEAVLPGR
jgi:predicted metal-dependent phosphoesterase TrpH